MPWSEDFKDCDEAWWPTSVPGRTIKPGMSPTSLTRHDWLIPITTAIPHLSGGATIVSDIAALAAAETALRADPGNAALRAARDAAKDKAGKAEAKFVEEYWKVLGFVRRDVGNNFFEQEQDWH